MLDTIQPPEPEYVMDEETARKLEETQRLQARKKNNTFFSRLYRSLAPTEDPEEELHPTSELPQQESDKKGIAKPNPKRKPELKQKKVKETRGHAAVYSSSDAFSFFGWRQYIDN